MLLLTTLSLDTKVRPIQTQKLYLGRLFPTAHGLRYMPPREKFAARVGLLLQKMTISIFCIVAFVRSHTLQKYVM